jgi:hypothetical protein
MRVLNAAVGILRGQIRSLAPSLLRFAIIKVLINLVPEG